MFRFIHSGDLHLGKRFGDLPSRLREARHSVIARLAEHAREQGATTILLAGDTFDTETPAPDVRRQALAEMGHHAPIQWVVLPGNHDSPQATQLWSTLNAEAPENVALAVDPRPIELATGVVLLSAPCTTRRPGRDLTQSGWTAKRFQRARCAHGAIRSFSEEAAASDVIAPEGEARLIAGELALRRFRVWGVL
ncbi:metallophosphoesterase [Rhizobium rhizogenes]